MSTKCCMPSGCFAGMCRGAYMGQACSMLWYTISLSCRHTTVSQLSHLRYLVATKVLQRQTYLKRDPEQSDHCEKRCLWGEGMNAACRRIGDSDRVSWCRLTWYWEMERLCLMQLPGCCMTLLSQPTSALLPTLSHNSSAATRWAIVCAPFMPCTK